MKLSRRVSWFLLAFGAWSWVIWITFVKNLWQDGSGLAFDAGRPTAYFWVHLTLAVVSFVLGTAIGLIGLRGVRAHRAAASGDVTPSVTRSPAAAPPATAERDPDQQRPAPTAPADRARAAAPKR